MESIELVPDASLIRFSGDVQLEHVYQKTGRLRGFRDSPVQLEGNGGGSVRIALSRGLRSAPHQVLSVSPTGISIEGVSAFVVADPSSGTNVFDTSSPSYNIPTPSRNLHVKVTFFNRS
jgi:beta-sarcoglycan